MPLVEGEQPALGRLAIYTHDYLSMSMTFIYRQLMRLSRWEPLVLAATTRNLDFFPYQDLTVHGPPRLARLRDAAQRRLLRRTPELSRGQRRVFRRSLVDARAVLVHAHFGPSGMEILPVARDLGIPLLVTFHGFDASSLLRHPWYVSGLRELFDHAHVIAVSRAMSERLIECGAAAERVHVLYIGVPLAMFPFVRRTPLVEKVRHGEVISFLQVANFVEKKGHPYTVRAFQRLHAAYPGSRLVLAGDGPFRAHAEHLARELDLGDSVQFLGKVDEDDVRRLMAGADVFVHHSVTADDGDQEGIPTAIMEAMASGLPVISTFHAGISELVDDRVSGYLVEERDVEEYCRRLIDVLADEGSMGRAGRDKVESQFNIDVQTQRLSALYREIGLADQFAGAAAPGNGHE